MLRTESAPTGLAKYIPIVGWLPRYRPAWLRAELLAGLVAAAVVIPQAMAYASVAGLPVQVGLYTALVPMLLYSLLGTSRRLSLSTTSTIAILTAATLAAAVRGGNPAEYMVPAATVALLTGVFLLLASVLRLGFLANFVSLPVLTGFKAGIGVVTFVGQLGKVLGVRLWLVALNPEPLTVVQSSSLGKELGRERMFLNVEQAVASYEKTQGQQMKEA